jgi:hypothetical protein
VKRHPFDAWSFGWGALFTIAAGLLASDRFDVFDLGDTSVAATAVIAVGAMMLVGAALGARSERAAVSPAAEGPEDEGAGETMLEPEQTESPEAPFDPAPGRKEINPDR